MPAIAEMIAGMACSYGQNNIDESSLTTETMIKPEFKERWFRQVDQLCGDRLSDMSNELNEALAA